MGSGQYALERSLSGQMIRDIEQHDLGARVHGIELLRQGLCLRCTPECVQIELMSAVGKLAADRRSDAAAGAGDERTPCDAVHCGCGPSSRLARPRASNPCAALTVKL